LVFVEVLVESTVLVVVVLLLIFVVESLESWAYAGRLKITKHNERSDLFIFSPSL